ncbi:MAG: tetratricopeptide repeat protein [Kiritimatiellae bacterium]|nr:tetratricopeptide repeat protein [Kiritimatiellia bacterium]
MPAVIFLVGLALRALYLAELARSPRWDVLAVDAEYHDYWAWGTVSGAWETGPNRPNPQIGSTPYFRPPLCPYMLALLYRVFGHSLLAVRLVQTGVGALSGVLAFLLARRLFGFWTGATAGLLAAVYWAFIYFDMEFREIVWLVALHLLIVLAMFGLRDRPAAWKALLAGAVIGLSALGKPNALLFAPVAAAWLAWVTRRTLRRRRRLTLAALLLLGVAAPVLPVTVRNIVRGGEFVLVSSNGGINLYIGNGPVATGYSVQLPDEYPAFNTAFDYPRIVAAVRKMSGKPHLNHAGVSRYFADRALDWIRANPGRTLSLMFRKAVLFWGGMEIVSEQDLNAARAESLILRAVPLNFAVVLAFGILGLLFAWRAGSTAGRARDPSRPGVLARPSAAGHLSKGEPGDAPAPDTRKTAAGPRREDLLLILLFVGIYFASFLPFFVTARYRVPIIPFVLVFAGYALCRLGRAVAARQWVSVAACAVGGSLLFAVISWNPFGITMNPSKALYDRAMDYDRLGRQEDAIRYYRQALDADPQNASAHHNLALDLLKLDRNDEAIVHFSESLRLVPNDGNVHHNVGVAFAKKGDLATAIAHYRESIRLQPAFHKAHLNLGLALKSLGRLQEALPHFSEAVRLYAQDDEARHALAGARLDMGVLLADQKRTESALLHLSQAIALDPQSAEAHNVLGSVLGLAGRREEAARQFAEALRLAPGYVNARFNLARVLAGEGKADEALAHYSQILKDAPKTTEVHYSIGDLLAAQGRFDEAIAHYSRETQLNPAFAGARYHLGLALSEQGRVAEAVAQLSEAVRLDPRSEKAKAALEAARRVPGEGE